MKSGTLARRLDSLLADTNTAASIATDPIRFPRRYTSVGDIEVAAWVSASLAFGRVSAFGPVLERIFAVADSHGGPAEFVASWDIRREHELAGIYYRWHPNRDILALLRLVGAVRNTYGSLGVLFTSGPMEQSLGRVISAVRALVPGDVSTHFRTFLVHPDDGSACKRWNMLLRWMVRREAPDLGIWTHLDPADLVIPLDTHVFRVARFLGLTERNAPGWAAAREITTSLAQFSPRDPVRYDFALAHLGISGRCKGHRDARICPECPLDEVCRAPGPVRP